MGRGTSALQGSRRTLSPALQRQEGQQRQCRLGRGSSIPADILFFFPLRSRSSCGARSGPAFRSRSPQPAPQERPYVPEKKSYSLLIVRILEIQCLKATADS
ncbi:hypothetical protein NDU88_000813 [Pleurodeles waltl]|uniref:Uncharacterized protein n=1 Tax=Pleurodeles waltl TaxID=8319 RepID=A0AAV7WMF9_PLEWA|nr:hypothetical protein NDU88_000813 [Pleurodeles waltl]